MSLTMFEQYVHRHSEWFRGLNAEPLDSLTAAERQLGLILPVTLKWLLSQYGYWKATGVGGLPFLIGATQAYRPTFPNNWLVLARPTIPIHELDGQQLHSQATSTTAPSQQGIVVLITGTDEQPDGQAVVVCDAGGQVRQRFSGFSQYAIACCQKLVATGDPWYQQCQPEFHRNPSSLLAARADHFDLAEFQLRLLETMLFAQIFEQPPSPDSDHATWASPVEQTGDERLEPMATEVTDPEATDAVVVATEIETEIEHLEVDVNTVPADPEPAILTAITDQVQATNVAAADPPEPAMQYKWRMSQPQAPARQEEKISDAKLRSVISRRRELLAEHIELMPRQFVYSSSSPNHTLVPPDFLPTGKLLITPVRQTDSLTQTFQGPLPMDIPAGQHVTLLSAGSDLGEQAWLASWVSHEQYEQVSRAYFEQTQSIPCWLLDAGETLDQVAPRLLEMSRQAAIF